MKLTYHHGRNFGDALNPLIFDALLPDFFNADGSTIFIGIGSIIGLKHGDPRTERRIYFSSGFAAGASSTYGTLPSLGPTDDVICVRGPLTARAMGLPPEKAIADGAILVRHLFDLAPDPSATTVSYMPHVGSFRFFADWKGLLSEIGIKVIDPTDPPMEVMRQIQASKVLLAEAMHGAIVADAIGVPWVPVSCYDTINQFKWRDFAASMGSDHAPHRLPALFDRAFSNNMVRGKLNALGLGFAERPVNGLYASYQRHVMRDRALRAFDRLKQVSPQLSDRALLDRKITALLEKVDLVKDRYGRRDPRGPYRAKASS